MFPFSFLLPLFYVPGSLSIYSQEHLSSISISTHHTPAAEMNRVKSDCPNDRLLLNSFTVARRRKTPRTSKQFLQQNSSHRCWAAPRFCAAFKDTPTPGTQRKHCQCFTLCLALSVLSAARQGFSAADNYAPLSKWPWTHHQWEVRKYYLLVK